MHRFSASSSRRLAGPCAPALALALVFALACAGCGTSPQDAAAATEPLHCTLVFLKTGPAKGLPAEEQRAAFQGHFDNMGRLAREKRLLLAGPFGQERHDPTLRDIFVLDTADRAEANAVAATDPAARAGIFTLECHDLVTHAPLRAMLDRELQREARLEAEGKEVKPGDYARTYALLFADDAEVALPLLERHPAVLLSGRLDGTRACAIVDAENAAAARTALGDVLDRLRGPAIDDWFATDLVAELPRLMRD